MHPEGPAAIQSYTDVLSLLTAGGAASSQRSTTPDLLFIRNVQGVEHLFQTMGAVNAAKSGAVDEEWNPLSQRPHSPLPPAPSHALGAEVWALKEAVDAFTTLAHEMMHVALWEPFFTGRWRPRGRKEFIEFSLLAEGYAFFFSDIVVSGAVRVRLPDGEYALDRQTSENARFHPSRAFKALGIDDNEAILDVYLEGFRGHQTRLWQPRGTSAYASSLAAQVHDFYTGSILPLHELHVAIDAFGGMKTFYRRFCAIANLPSCLGESDGCAPGDGDLKTYFVNFYRSGLTTLASRTTTQVARIRMRRLLQMRAYYALQVRWLVEAGLVVAKRWTTKVADGLIVHVDRYLAGLEMLLKLLAKGDRTAAELTEDLGRLDTLYDVNVRRALAAHDAWVGRRWMIVPRRAGGLVDALGAVKAADAKVTLLRLSAFLVDDLTRRMRSSKTVEERAVVMAQIGKIASLGAAGGQTATKARAALTLLQRELVKPYLREAWSVPLASVSPREHAFRELAFSYQ